MNKLLVSRVETQQQCLNEVHTLDEDEASSFFHGISENSFLGIVFLAGVCPLNGRDDVRAQFVLLCTLVAPTFASQWRERIGGL